MPRRSFALFPVLACTLAFPLAAQALPQNAPGAPLRSVVPEPVSLDLRGVDGTQLVPKDNRDAAQAEAVRQRWAPLVAGLKGAPAVRLLLPTGEGRVSLLLAAAQALKAQAPAQRLYVAFDPQAMPLLEETAWGAVDGGALVAADLNPDPEAWRGQLTRAQDTFPGRPWTLWLPSDPGPLLSVLMGDGGRAVVPAGGPAARLAEALPPGFTEVEGGPGDLTLRNRKGESRRWVFAEGAWSPAPLPKDRHEVAVTAAEAYDVGALLAKVRATQLRSRAAVKTVQAKADLDLHLQGGRGPGGDLGFRFAYFEKAGEWPELLQKEVRFNGVTAKLDGEVQLPLIESRQSMSLPVALGLTERYRYRDGGPAGPGRRRLRFEPVGADPLLYSGELEVEEASGRILMERRERTNLPGTVKSEREILTYGQVAPDAWRPTSVQTFERWVSADGVVQVQRRFTYRDFEVNGGGFETARTAARTSGSTMLKVTPEGARYFTRQGDGTRKIEEKPKSSGRALAAVVLVDPGLTPPVAPLGGFLYFDYNAFGKGIQLNALTAILFNTASLAIPRGLGSFDVSADATALLIKGTERPVENGRLSDKDGVGRRFGKVGLELGRDLGLGFRLEGRGDFEYDDFSEGDSKYRTPGYLLPPSGLTRVGTLQGSWLYRGFQVRAFHGWGRRPEGTYGLATDPQLVPEGGDFRRWGGSLGLDREVRPGFWFHGEAGWASGRAFDRFKALDVGGLGGAVRIAGIRANAITADRLVYAKTALAIPTGPNLRLSVSLEHARARSLDDQKTYGVSGVGLAGDLPGFWLFTAVRVDLGLGVQSDIAGVKTVNGFIALLRVF
ncbi:hypothetical protein GETHOR_26810 [Geothrix oryzae]|uniref:MucB/RseB N-terminal domain-containing protein n=1 Tax=Geothrix oryzae TaxID=2927975 RepID=A0ABN6V9X1_9BACT|nr:hypothetical protein [Geothrix oryzae]BDU70580.1 hypothetical protein GETHOR_26810 [Geothrix oryzae]